MYMLITEAIFNIEYFFELNVNAGELEYFNISPA